MAGLILGMEKLVNTDLAELAGSDPESLTQYIGVKPTACILAGVAVLVVIIALCAVCVVLRRRRARLIMEMERKELSERPVVTGITVGKLHEQGARGGQQDCFGVSDESFMDARGLLAVVADGMGGLADGDRVSAAAVETVLDGFAMCPGRQTPEQLLLFLARSAVERVNGMLGADGLKKSGTTLVMGLVRDGKFSFLSVGDSRICLYRSGELMQLNREHIFMHKLALDAVNGEIALQEVYADKRKSGLTSFLGMGALTHIDMPAEPLALLPGDKILLMSDGVYNALSAQELTDCLAETPEESAERLRQAITGKAFTNQDNYTAVILACEGQKEGSMD